MGEQGNGDLGKKGIILSSEALDKLIDVEIPLEISEELTNLRYNFKTIEPVSYSNYIKPRQILIY
jgi:hypothetical protein